MRWYGLAVVALGFGAAALAQQRGMYGGISTGRIVGSFGDPGFASGLGATVSGLPQTTTRVPLDRRVFGGGYRGGFAGGRFDRTRTVVVPWGLPFFYGGYFSSIGSEGMVPAPTIVEPVQSAPSVIINQYFTPEVVRPQMREYRELPESAQPSTPEARVTPQEAQQPKTETRASKQPSEAEQAAAQQPTITLLAFSDSSVAAAIAYWVQGDELHYVARNFAKRVVPLKLLDVELSRQLNRERNVEFRLEPAR